MQVLLWYNESNQIDGNRGLKIKSSSENSRSTYLYLAILLIISLISHFPFVLKGFGELDATKIAVSVIDILNHGSEAAFANFYFTDVVPLYILYLKLAMKLLNNNYSYLPIVMNYTNAVFGTLTIIPAYYLIYKLFKKTEIAFYSVLALIFAPSFYQANIIGFPHLPAFFFLLTSFYFFLSGLDQNRRNRVFLFMVLSCFFLTVSVLFKSDYVLAFGTFFGFLFIRKVKDNGKIFSAFLVTLISGALFLLLRHFMLGSTGGMTMSGAGMSKWFDFFFTGVMPSPALLKRQISPIIYGAGVATFCAGIISFIYFLLKRRLDILIFVISWTAAPTLLWLIIGGNNARHNMLSILPFLVMSIMIMYEKAPKYLLLLSGILMLINFWAIPPSSSILRPSGNVFKSHALLEERMIKFHANAQEIAKIDEDKIAVLGYFHNPHVIFEIMRLASTYEAVKIGREDYRINAGDKEYVFVYFVTNPVEMDKDIDDILEKYHLENHLFVSVTYDLKSLNNRDLRTKTLDIIKKSFL